MDINPVTRGRLTIAERIERRGPRFQKWLLMNGIKAEPAGNVVTLDPYTLSETRVNDILLAVTLSDGLKHGELTRLAFQLKALGGGQISYSKALELVARAMGYKNITLAAMCRDPEDPDRYLENIWEGSVRDEPVFNLPTQFITFAENPHFLQLFKERANKNRELSAAKKAEREKRRDAQRQE